MREIMTYEVCREYASRCKTQTELRKLKWAAYENSLKNGWLTEFMKEFNWPCGHSGLTFEQCREFASHCSYKTELRDKKWSAYETSLKNGWLTIFAKEFNWPSKGEASLRTKLSTGSYQEKMDADIVSTAKKYPDYTTFRGQETALYSYLQKHHKLELINFLPRKVSFADGHVNDTVYVYEFHDIGMAYVGRTVHLLDRDREHRTRSNDSLCKFITKNGFELPVVKILAANLDLNDGPKMECSMIALYKSLGWKMINSVKGGSLGSIGSGKWTESKLLEVAGRFEYWDDLEKEYPGAHRRIRNMKWKFPWLKDKKPFRCMVDQYSMDGTFIRSYESMAKAERSTGIAQSSIGQVCMGKARSAGGYKWQYHKSMFICHGVSI